MSGRLLHMALWMGISAAIIAADAGAQVVQPSAQPGAAALPTANPPNRRTVDLNLNNTPLDQAFKDVADQSGARIYVRWSALEAAGIPRNTTITLNAKNVRWRTALNILCDIVSDDVMQLSTKNTADDVVQISTAEDNNRETDIVVRFYNIQSLIEATLRLKRVQALNARDVGTVQDAIDQLTYSIESTIKTETWKDNGGAAGSLRVFANTLIVSTTPEIQDQVEAMLKRLRSELSTPAPSAR